MDEKSRRIRVHSGAPDEKDAVVPDVVGSDGGGGTSAGGVPFTTSGAMPLGDGTDERGTIPPTHSWRTSDLGRLGSDSENLGERQKAMSNRPWVRDQVNQYRPNPHKLTQLFAAGLTASVAMMALGYLFGLFGVQPIDFSAIYGAIPNGGVYPAAFSALWWLGMAWHLVNGAILFPLIYDFLADKKVLTNTRLVKGVTWGVALWLMNELVVKPLAGDGVFSSRWDMPVLVSLMTLACWLVYGVVKERTTRTSIVHELYEPNRRAA